MSTTAPWRVAVVGGGITGLSAAYRLGVEGGARVSVRVFERSAVAGGRIGTEHREGFLLENGPDTFLARKPETAELAAELGLEGELLAPRSAQRGAFVARNGTLVRVPEGMSGLVPGRLAPLFRSRLLSWRGRIRAACEPLVPAGERATEETVAAFAKRRFGAEVYDRLLEPLLCGIYAGDGDRLSATTAVPQLVDLEQQHGSVLRGVRRQRRGNGAVGPGFLTFRTGMGTLVRGLLAQLGDGVACGRPVNALERVADRWIVRSGGESSEWDAVILAGPAWMGAELLRAVDAELTSQLSELEFASVAAVWCAYPAGDVPGVPRGHGYVIPRSEHRPALACSWTDQKLEGRAPAGMRLFRVFVGRAGSPVDHVSRDELVDTARDELRYTLRIEAPPCLVHVVKHARSMPQYTVGHGQRIARIRERVGAQPGLYVAGNWLDGVGVSDCIRSGNVVARAVVGGIGG